MTCVVNANGDVIGYRSAVRIPIGEPAFMLFILLHLYLGEFYTGHCPITSGDRIEFTDFDILVYLPSCAC